MKRVLKWLLVAVALLVVITGIALVWLLRSEAGLRFALARAIAATDGKLTVESAEGRLAGPLTLQDVRWRDVGTDVRIGRVTLDIAPLALLRARIARTTHCYFGTVHSRTVLSLPADSAFRPSGMKHTART